MCSVIQQSFWKVTLPPIAPKRKKRFRVRDSAVETAYAQLLTKRGIDFKRQYRISRIRVDFYVPSKNLIIEVNGCYWHCCRKCGFKDTDGKRRRDLRRIAFLRSRGYRVRVVWEHDIRKGIAK